MTISEVPLKTNDTLTEEVCQSAANEAVSSLRLLNFMMQLEVSRWDLPERWRLQKDAAFLLHQEIASSTVLPQDILASIAGDRRPVRSR